MFSASFSTFNARADGVATKPAFKSAWKKGQRCLVIVDGSYEWRKKDKQPFAIGLVAMTMAGLWDVWRSPTGETVRSCTIITTEANEEMSALHDRMPVILEEPAWPTWLGEIETSEDELRSVLAPCPSEWLQMWPVGKAVGNVKNNGRELAEPLAA